MKNIKNFNESLEDGGLLKDLKSLDLHKDFDKLSGKEQQKYIDLVFGVLGDSLFCRKSDSDWSWSRGTITQNDFYPAADDMDYVYKKAKEIYDKLLENRC